MANRPIRLRFHRIFMFLLVGLSALGLFIFGLIKVAGNGMYDNKWKYSFSIKESKSNNFFLGYYKPLKDTLVLDNLRFKIKNIWYEKNWTTEHKWGFVKEYKIFPGIHIIAPYSELLSNEANISCDILNNENGYFTNMGEASHHGYTYTLSSNPDTIKLLFSTKYGGGLRDTVIYVKE